jgi:hypothetical protein
VLNELYDKVGYGPFEEVELSDGGLDEKVIIRERDALPSAKGVKACFRVGFELQFVIIIYFKSFDSGVRISDIICSKILFGIISDKPVN